MRSCDCRDHSEHDRKQSGAPTSRCDRCRYRVPRDIDHLVRGGPNHRTTNGKCSSTRIASCDRASRSHRSACNHELVLSQDLLG